MGNSYPSWKIAHALVSELPGVTSASLQNGAGARGNDRRQARRLGNAPPTGNGGTCYENTPGLKTIYQTTCPKASRDKTLSGTGAGAERYQP